RIDLIRSAAWPLWYTYEIRTLFREGEGHIGRAVEMARGLLSAIEPGGNVAERMQLETTLGCLLAYQAFFYLRLGRNDEALGLFQSSISFLRKYQEPFLLSYALAHYGLALWLVGRFEDAVPAVEESLALCRPLDDRWHMALYTTFLGMVVVGKGDNELAYKILNRAMPMCRQLGDPRLITLAVGFLSRAAQLLGKESEVLALLQEGLQVATETGDRFGMGLALERMAQAAQVKGEKAEAQRLLKESIRLFHEAGDMWSLCRAYTVAGNLALEESDLVRARQSFIEAYKAGMTAKTPPSALAALAGLVTVYSLEGRDEQAMELAFLVLDHPASPPDTRAGLEKICADLETRLKPRQVQAAHSKAGTLDLYFLGLE
ncbi:MAG: tetratricopeptide repeat protein, partial [Bacteroidota bacterium]